MPDSRRATQQPTMPAPTTATRSPTSGAASHRALTAVSTVPASTARSAGTPSGTTTTASAGTTYLVWWGWRQKTSRPTQVGRALLDDPDVEVAVLHRTREVAVLEGRSHRGVLALGHPALEDQGLGAPADGRADRADQHLVRPGEGSVTGRSSPTPGASASTRVQPRTRPHPSDRRVGRPVNSSGCCAVLVSGRETRRCRAQSCRPGGAAGRAVGAARGPLWALAPATGGYAGFVGAAAGGRRRGGRGRLGPPGTGPGPPRPARLGPADHVTVTRGTLACVVAALTTHLVLGSAVHGGSGQSVRAPLVLLATVALSLDAVDGWLARRTHTATPLGARFDMEVDAFLILVLSVAASPAVGWWVLAIGLFRYLLVLAAWVAPWLGGPVPPRYWRKGVAALQGIVLTVVVAAVLPRPTATGVAAAALALLAWSFGTQGVELWRARAAAQGRRPALSAATALPLVVLPVADAVPAQRVRVAP